MDRSPLQGPFISRRATHREYRRPNGHRTWPRYVYRSVPVSNPFSNIIPRLSSLSTPTLAKPLISLTLFPTNGTLYCMGIQLFARTLYFQWVRYWDPLIRPVLGTPGPGPIPIPPLV